MNINEVYKIVSYLVDKYQGTYLSPDDFNMVINMAQNQYLSFLTDDTGSPNRNPKNPVGMSTSAIIADTLSGFLTESIVAVSSQLAVKPANMYKTVAVRTTDDNYAMRFISSDKVASFIDNAIDPPSATEPVYYEIGSNYKIYPSSVSSIKVSYIKNPQTLKWAYTGALIYDAANSVPANNAALEWGDTDVYEIIYRTVGIIGINLKDGDLMRVAQVVKNDGL
jgi:ribosomal protein L20A (L18A)